MSDVLRLEGFNANVKSQRIWICGKANTLGQQIISRLSAVEEELLNRGRKVLILQNVRDISMRWSQKIQWDAVFRIRDTQDLRLAMTYIQNVSVKPVRVVWIGDEPPMPVLSFMQKQEVTFLVGSISVPRGSWSAIFWHSSADEKEIQDGLQNRPGSQINLSQVLKELRAVSAGLVWSCIGETGSLYWYDSEENGTTNHIMDTRDIVESLKEVVDALSNKI